MVHDIIAIPVQEKEEEEEETVIVQDQTVPIFFIDVLGFKFSIYQCESLDCHLTKSIEIGATAPVNDPCPSSPGRNCSYPLIDCCVICFYIFGEHEGIDQQHYRY